MAEPIAFTTAGSGVTLPPGPGALPISSDKPSTVSNPSVLSKLAPTSTGIDPVVHLAPSSTIQSPSISQTGAAPLTSGNQPSRSLGPGIIIFTVIVPIIVIILVGAGVCWYRSILSRRRRKAQAPTVIDPVGPSFESDPIQTSGLHGTVESTSSVPPMNSPMSYVSPGRTVSQHLQQPWSLNALAQHNSTPPPERTQFTYGGQRVSTPGLAIMSPRSAVSHHNSNPSGPSSTESNSVPHPLNSIIREPMSEGEWAAGDERTERIMMEMNTRFTMLGEKLERLEAALEDRPGSARLNVPPRSSNRTLTPESPPKYVSRQGTVLAPPEKQEIHLTYNGDTMV